MLIDSYDLKIEVADHSSEVFEYEATALLGVNIREVLPYLNATINNGTYYTDGPVFSWRIDDHKVGFWHDRIAVDNLESRDQAEDVIAQLVKLVNDTWEKRDEITPDTRTHENLQPLEVYRLLPKTNCKICGEGSCFNFGLKLAAGMAELKSCSPLFDDVAFRDNLERLEYMVSIKRPLL